MITSGDGLGQRELELVVGSKEGPPLTYGDTCHNRNNRGSWHLLGTSRSELVGHWEHRPGLVL